MSEELLFVCGHCGVECNTTDWIKAVSEELPIICDRCGAEDGKLIEHANLCFECSNPKDHEHHVVPRSLGGMRTVPLCERCHGLVHGRVFNIKFLTSKAMTHKKAKGERVGNVAYGYRLAPDGVALVENASEQAVIARVVEARGRGLTMRAIVTDLEAAGCRGRTGKPLALGQVANILWGEAKKRKP